MSQYFQVLLRLSSHNFAADRGAETSETSSDVFNILLQILEDGRLTDGQGRTVDFRNTLAIMTSNLGTTELNHPPVGFLRDSGAEQESVRLRSSIEDALKKTFRPEFLNRIDEIIIFDMLTADQIQEIVDLMVKEVENRLSEHQVTISLTDEAKRWLAEQVFGARPLRRAIQRYIETPLSKRILAGEFGAGDHVMVDAEESELTFVRTAVLVGVAAQT